MVENRPLEDLEEDLAVALVESEEDPEVDLGFETVQVEAGFRMVIEMARTG